MGKQKYGRVYSCWYKSTPKRSLHLFSRSDTVYDADVDADAEAYTKQLQMSVSFQFVGRKCWTIIFELLRAKNEFKSWKHFAHFTKPFFHGIHIDILVSLRSHCIVAYVSLFFFSLSLSLSLGMCACVWYFYIDHDNESSFDLLQYNRSSTKRLLCNWYTAISEF